MKLTEQQRAAVAHDGHAFLIACPGSGKTRTIIAKLLRCIDNIRGTPRRVACITYTNTAVDEINSRVRQYGASGDEDLCEVSTIHAFCQNEILRHFHWKIPGLEKGFSVLPADSEHYQTVLEAIAEQYDINRYGRQAFESLNRSPNGDPIAPPSIPPDAAAEFWSRLLADGYVDFCNLVYLSHWLLSNFPGVRQGLAARFAHLLIDEFQDTSALQVEILRSVFREGMTEIFLVGDPEQSIYSFAGAEREMMFAFAEEISAVEFPLSGNYRCSQPIVDVAGRLINRSPAMFSVGEASRIVEEPIYVHAQDDFAAITDEFLPRVDKLGLPLGECAILAPSWFQLVPIGIRLRQYGVAVVGPGARPYKRLHLVASLAEQICAYIEKPRPEILPAAERDLFFTCQKVTGKANFRAFGYDGRRTLFRLIREGAILKEKHEGAGEWLLVAAERFAQILRDDDFVAEHHIPYFTESAQAILEDMTKRGVDIANMTLADLGMFACPQNSVKLMTLHGAKGREFSAVSVISLHDGLIPYHNFYNPVTEDGLAEARRLLYVAVTRAKRLLMLSSNMENKNPPCRFLQELRIGG